MIMEILLVLSFLAGAGAFFISETPPSDMVARADALIDASCADGFTPQKVLQAAIESL